MTLPPDFPFLGPPSVVPDRFSPRHGIRYNDQGYSQPINWNKRIKKLRNRQGIDLTALVPAAELERIKAWPGSPDAIGDWIDAAWDANHDLFAGCRGAVGDRVRSVTPARISKITIMPSIFQVKDGRWASGAYFSDSREIKVLNVYWWASQGWLKNAKDLLGFEIGNALSVECGITPEDPNGPGGRPQGWPCIR